MKQLMRRLSQVADATLTAVGKEIRHHRRHSAAQGHVPVYVGEEMERFEVRMELLSRPIFIELLRQSEQEYGYGQHGPLRIPCSASLFRRVLRSLIGGAGEAEEELVRAAAAED